jgi:hypothetical protein
VISLNRSNNRNTLETICAGFVQPPEDVERSPRTDDEEESPQRYLATADAARALVGASAALVALSR